LLYFIDDRKKRIDIDSKKSISKQRKDVVISSSKIERRTHPVMIHWLLPHIYMCTLVEAMCGKKKDGVIECK